MPLCVFPSSFRWTCSSIRWQLRWSALCVPFCLQGKDLPLLYLWWTCWRAAVVLHLVWLWDRAEIFFLHREERWAKSWSCDVLTCFFFCGGDCVLHIEMSSLWYLKKMRVGCWKRPELSFYRQYGFSLSVQVIPSQWEQRGVKWHADMFTRHVDLSLNVRLFPSLNFKTSYRFSDVQ